MNNKREVIFDMPDTYGRYRVVCQFGFDHYIYYAWWGLLQKEIDWKLWPWSKSRKKWVEIDRCWWSKEITSLEQLKKNAELFYDENVELYNRITQRAMNLK